MIYRRKRRRLGYMALVSSQGMYMTVLPDKTPCLSCVFTEMPVGGLTCDTAGIISPAVQMVSLISKQRR
ncbi:hypothetical protein ACEQPO_11545 [Bacillus sp. SL00103]